ncbi:MAG: hypothetical protein WC242_05320 [Candidatus Paceibacterota bacterium]|jgi:hypothetical protein
MNQQELNGYKLTVEKIEIIFKQEEKLKQMFSDKWQQKLNSSFEMFRQQINDFIKDEKEKIVSEQEIEKAREIIGVFLEIVLEKPITPIIKELIGNYSLFIFNWNQMLGKDPTINQNLKLIDGIIKAQSSLMEAIAIIQLLMNRARRFIDYEPPAFDLSRSYLLNLKEAIEKENLLSCEKKQAQKKQKFTKK